MLIEAAEAQKIFDSLPPRLRVPTLSPAYGLADALRDSAMTPLFLLHRGANGVLMHNVQEGAVPQSDLTDWQSPYGYGGPVAHELSREEIAQAWESLDAVVRDRRVLAEFVRFHPVLGNERDYPGSVLADRKVVAVDLSVPDLMQSYASRARTAIRKALAQGLTAHWESREDAERYFPAFYTEGMRRIGASSFYFFPDAYFRALLALPGARVLTILQGNERISMGLFLFGPEVVEYHLSATAPAGRALGATNLLLHEAASRAQQEGRKQLYLGGGTSAAPDDPLLRFKSSFAEAGLTFHVGHRVHDPGAYEALRLRSPEPARSSRRILFYRG